MHKIEYFCKVSLVAYAIALGFVSACLPSLIQAINLPQHQPIRPSHFHLHKLVDFPWVGTGMHGKMMSLAHHQNQYHQSHWCHHLQWDPKPQYQGGSVIVQDQLNFIDSNMILSFLSYHWRSMRAGSEVLPHWFWIGHNILFFRKFRDC